MTKKLLAEFIGTFWLVLGGCGTAILATGYVGISGIALAFGLSVLTMAYAIGHISGCHLNPAVTIGLWISGRFRDLKEVISYIISQVLGGSLGAWVIYIIGNGSDNFMIGSFATNGFGEFSPMGYSMISAFIIEAVLTGVFLLIIIGATDERAPKGFAPIAIGLALTLIHLISIPVTNTSVNPARSTGVALVTLFAGASTSALSQLWLFWVAPIVGAIVAGLLYRCVFEE
ncbi:aquaporin Z [Fusobacterium mortiferum]|uniref:aquaporin Z n=1 Tax=Fusobacterium mortiferum TaxID=850 RepID=UPI003F92AADF